MDAVIYLNIVYQADTVVYEFNDWVYGLVCTVHTNEPRRPLNADIFLVDYRATDWAARYHVDFVDFLVYHTDGPALP